MQKTYGLLVLILVSGFFSNSFASEAHRINPRLIKGKCKSLVIKCFCDINRKDSITKWERCYYDDYDSLIYDRKGNVLSSSFLFDWKSQSAIFEYDSLSNQTASYSYDSKGKLTNNSKSSYQFDNKGHIIESVLIETSYDISNVLISKLKYKYDELGNQIECSISSPKESSSKWMYKFNENNKIVEEIYITAKGLTWTRDSYQYDNHGNRISWEHFNSKDQLTSRIRQNYDNSNNLIDNEVYELRNGQLQFLFRTHLKYDRSNNQTEVSTYNEKGDLLSKIFYDYKYDNQGNWIECAEMYKNEPVKKIIRRIEYY